MHTRSLTVVAAALFVGTTLGVVSGVGQVNSQLKTFVRAQEMLGPANQPANQAPANPPPDNPPPEATSPANPCPSPTVDVVPIVIQKISESIDYKSNAALAHFILRYPSDCLRFGPAWVKGLTLEVAWSGLEGDGRRSASLKNVRVVDAGSDQIVYGRVAKIRPQGERGDERVEVVIPLRDPSFKEAARGAEGIAFPGEDKQTSEKELKIIADTREIRGVQEIGTVNLFVKIGHLLTNLPTSFSTLGYISRGGAARLEAIRDPASPQGAVYPGPGQVLARFGLSNPTDADVKLDNLTLQLNLGIPGNYRIRNFHIRSGDEAVTPMSTRGNSSRGFQINLSGFGIQASENRIFEVVGDLPATPECNGPILVKLVSVRGRTQPQDERFNVRFDPAIAANELICNPSRTEGETVSPPAPSGVGAIAVVVNGQSPVNGMREERAHLATFDLAARGGGEAIILDTLVIEIPTSMSPIPVPSLDLIPVDDRGNEVSGATRTMESLGTGRFEIRNIGLNLGSPRAAGTNLRFRVYADTRAASSSDRLRVGVMRATGHGVTSNTSVEATFSPTLYANQLGF